MHKITALVTQLEDVDRDRTVAVQLVDVDGVTYVRLELETSDGDELAIHLTAEQARRLLNGLNEAAAIVGNAKYEEPTPPRLLASVYCPSCGHLSNLHVPDTGCDAFGCTCTAVLS